MSVFRKINGEMIQVSTEGHPQYYFETQAQAEAVLPQLEEGADVFVEEGSNEDLLSRIEQVEEDIVQLNTDLSSKQDKTDNSLATTSKNVVGAINELKTGKVSKGAVLVNQGASLTIGTSFTLSDSVDNYDYIIVEAYAHVGLGTSRKFSTADFYASSDKGYSQRYIGLSHYYDATYHASVGFIVNSDGKHITVAERSVSGYQDVCGIMVVGINF